MAYQVLARKWRPQRFDDVVGQQAVTRTLRNAIASGRIAHAFVFAGPRGCGKTTTARILARALNCVKGPTRRSVRRVRRLHRDRAGTRHRRARDRRGQPYRHRQHPRSGDCRPVDSRRSATATRSSSSTKSTSCPPPSFNALLKSIEEPPAHVVFMMATTELHKIPDTILSRSQVFEFRTIPTKAIAAAARGRLPTRRRIDVPDAALALIARAAEGSMRDAQSALDQVIAFAGADGDGGRRVDGARAGRARPAVRPDRGGGGRGRAARVRAGRPRGRVRPRSAAGVPRAVARGPRHDAAVGRSVACRRRRARRRRARAADRARRAASRAKI